MSNSERLGYYLIGIDANPAAVALYGYSRDELLGLRQVDLSAEPEETLRAAREALAFGAVLIPLRYHRKKDGTIFPVEVRMGPFSLDGRRALLASFRDITERKRTEAELERMRRILYEGQMLAHVGSFEYHADTRETIWSDEEFRIYGLEPGPHSPSYRELLARHIHPDDVALLDETFKTCLLTGSVYCLDHRIVRPDGTVRWVQDIAYPILGEDGGVIQYFGATLDITERKQAEAWRTSQFILDQIRDIVFLMRSEDGQFLQTNTAAEQAYGFSGEELLSLSIQDIAADGRKGEIQEQSEGGRGALFESIHQRQDGSRFPVEVSMHRAVIGDESVLIAVVRDITSRKRIEEERGQLERKLVYAQKLESLGILAGGIAHDFNNLLMGVLGHAELALFEVPEGGPASRHLGHIKTAAQRLADISQQMLAYSGRGRFFIRLIDLWCSCVR